MMTRQQAYRRLAVILLIFAGVTMAHSIFLPLHKASDEYAHFKYTRFITQAGRLPLTYEERAQADYRANQPPLYHVLFALLADWSVTDTPPRLKFVSESPRFELVQQFLSTKRLANTEDELLPFQGAVLIWHLGRLLSLALGVVLVVVTFFTALEIFPGNYSVAVVSTALLAFTPTFIYIGGSLSDDPLVGLMIGLYFLMLVKIIKGRTGLLYFVLLGLFMGLAVTTKNSAVILPLEVVGVFLYLAWHHRWRWPVWLGRVAIVAGVSIVVSSWWYGTILIYFNRIEELGLVAGLVKPLLASGVNASEQYMSYVITGGAVGFAESPEFMSESYGEWALHLYRTFWTWDINGFPLGPGAFFLIGIALLVSVIGLIYAWRQTPRYHFWIALLAIHFLIFFMFPLIRHAIQGNASQTGQGRHVLFPAATVFPLLLVFGWRAVLPGMRQRLLSLVVLGGLLTWSLVQLVWVVDYPHWYLPVRTVPAAANAIPHRLDQPIGDELILVGYDYALDPTQSALKLSLYWRATTYPDEDYRINVSLVQAGIPALSWTMYPLNGRYPTRIWEQNELIRDDIFLPLVDVPTGSYQIQLQLSGSQGVLPVGEDDVLVLEKVDLPAMALPPMDLSFSANLNGHDEQFDVTLWQAQTRRGDILPEFKPRMQIPLVWQGTVPADLGVRWLLAGPDDGVYQSTPISDHVALFQVGLDWPSGDYRLRLEIWRHGAVIASQEAGTVVAIENRNPRLLVAPPISHSVNANFANRLQLLGYDLPLRILKQGQGVPVTLYWQGLRTMGTSFTVFAKLLDQQGQQVWGSIERYPADGYQTIYWLENEIVVDGFELPVEPNTPTGIYWLNVGLYEEVKGQAVSLPLVVNGQPAGETSVTFGPVKIGDTPPEVVLSPSDANPQIELNLALGNPPVIRLRGYDLLQLNDMLDVTLYWESLTPTPVNWSVFVHVRDETGETVTQKDDPVGGGRYPTSVWEAGELIPDHLLVPLPQELPTGDYAVVVGLYDFATGVRLPVADHANGEIKISTIVKQ